MSLLRKETPRDKLVHMLKDATDLARTITLDQSKRLRGAMKHGEHVLAHTAPSPCRKALVPALLTAVVAGAVAVTTWLTTHDHDKRAKK